MTINQFDRHQIYPLTTICQLSKYLFSLERIPVNVSDQTIGSQKNGGQGDISDIKPQKIDETVKYSRGINSILARFFFNIDLYCPLIFPLCDPLPHLATLSYFDSLFLCTQTREEINQYNKYQIFACSFMLLTS